MYEDDDDEVGKLLVDLLLAPTPNQRQILLPSYMS